MDVFGDHSKVVRSMKSYFGSLLPLSVAAVPRVFQAAATTRKEVKLWQPNTRMPVEEFPIGRHRESFAVFSSGQKYLVKA